MHFSVKESLFRFPNLKRFGKMKNETYYFFKGKHHHTIMNFVDFIFGMFTRRSEEHPVSSPVSETLVPKPVVDYAMLKFKKGDEVKFVPSDRRSPENCDYIEKLQEYYGPFVVHRVDINNTEIICSFPTDDCLVQSFGICMFGTAGPGRYLYLFNSDKSGDLVKL